MTTLLPERRRLIVRLLAISACLSLLLDACASGPVAPTQLAGPEEHFPAGAVPTRGLSWAEVMDLLQDQGFSLADGASDVGDGCWTAEAFVLHMRTTLFIDQAGRVFEDFAPDHCKQ